MAQKKTREQYIEELKVKNPNLELVGDYIDAKTKTPHRCKKHLVVWDISPDSALHGSGCKQCLREKIGNKNRKSEEDYIRELAVKNPTVELCDTYIGNKIPVKHHCMIHDIYWDITPNNALYGDGCKLCCRERIGNALRKTEEEYIAELAIKNPTIKLRGKYVDTDTITKHYCESHKILFSTRPARALQGCGCHKCHREKLPQCQPKPEDQYVRDLANIHPNIILKGRYINSATPTLHECIIHQFEWEPSPSNLLARKGCPKCCESQGEKQITLWLREHDIFNTSQKRFEDCRDINTLPFDFYIPKLNVCIEYQGEQHYRPVNFGGISDEEAYSNFVKTQYHDEIKRNYCDENNINLICIPYWEDVDGYLNKNLLI